MGGICVVFGYQPLQAGYSKCTSNQMPCSVSEMITPIQLKYPDLVSIPLPEKQLKQAVVCFYLPDGTKLFEKRLEEGPLNGMTLAEILHHFKGQVFKMHRYYCCIVREECLFMDVRNSGDENRLPSSTLQSIPGD